MNLQFKERKGITLIALVVTVIVLLILAAVSIATLTGENGLLSKTNEAKEKTEIAEIIEKAKIDIYGFQAGNNGEITEEEVDAILDPKYGTISGEGEEKILTTEKGYEIKVSDIWSGTTSGGGIAVGEVARENTTIDGKEGSYSNPTIPMGFKAVDTETAKWGTEEGYQNGLVIEDATGDSITNGSQFVWVPVQDYENNFHLIDGYYDNSIDGMLSEASNPSREAGSNNTAPYTPGKPNEANTTVGTEESMAMYKSVKDNGGFYIARYEAGINGTIASTETNDENKQTQNGTVKPVSKANVGVWNWIVWGGRYSETSQYDGLPGDDTQDGAVKVARSMYNNPYTGNKNTNTTVKSTLCYGVQWDAVMNFIDSSYVNADGNATGYVKDSKGKGNYSGTIATTGLIDDYAIKNIYDMAGNVHEWTMEAYNTTYRVYRGGNYHDSGFNGPASLRGNYNPDDSNDNVGFRVTLYL